MRQDETGGLTLLGNKKPVGEIVSVDAGLLEAFPNQFVDRFYLISIVFPEFTSLCPVTGQPDFATICLEYIPGQLCVESKSFKLYMFSYRSHASFMETITNTILDDICKLLDPCWCRVRGLFKPRGATRIHVFAERFGSLAPDQLRQVAKVVDSWRAEANPHGF